MIPFVLPERSVAALVEKVQEVRPITENTQESGKLYAYVQVAVVLLRADCRGNIEEFTKAIVQKAREASWEDRPWMKQFHETNMWWSTAAAP